jgi:hypothetical protein
MGVATGRLSLLLTAVLLSTSPGRGLAKGEGKPLVCLLGELCVSTLDAADPWCILLDRRQLPCHCLLCPNLNNLPSRNNLHTWFTHLCACAPLYIRRAEYMPNRKEVSDMRDAGIHTPEPDGGHCRLEDPKAFSCGVSRLGPPPDFALE